LYARLWEDDAVLRAGLALTPTDDVLSIAAAGDNSLTLLLDDPRSVTMLDRNTTQLALCHLKIACIRHLEPAQARGFLGIEPATDRLKTYATLRPHLPQAAQQTWDNAQSELDSGVLDTGKFERYLTLFRTRLLPFVQWPSTVQKMAALADLPAQRELYDRAWNTWRWRTLFRLFFSRFVMERRGRERAFFDQVTEKSIGDVFLGRAKKALCDLTVADNPYLLYAITGRNLVPAYLDDEHFFTIRERLDRLRIVEDDLTGHLSSVEKGAYTAYNLSDCFEYMPRADANGLLAAIADKSNAGARLVYWNLLVPRDGAELPDRLQARSELETKLHAGDRAFFYGRLVIEHVR